MSISLQDPKQPWPPKEWGHYLGKIQVHAAWWSGNPETLANLYAQHLVQASPHGSFWARQLSDERRVAVHVPVAKDIASVSADLLFSEPPKVQYPDDPTVTSRLETILNGTGFFRMLLEAAETASALGGVYIKVNFDRDIAPYPIPTIAQPDSGIPIFYDNGMGLKEVLFHRVVFEDNDVTIRLIEIQSPGVIKTMLFQGDSNTLGRRIPLDAVPGLEGLDEVVETGLPGLSCVYVPNRLPNPDMRGLPVGASDFQGLESLMDSLDDAATSLVRDIRLGYTRVLLPESFLIHDPATADNYFNVDQEAFVPLDIPTGDGNDIIKHVQPEIRAQEHLDTMRDLTTRIYSGAGYAPQSFGLDIEGRAESGTALKIRERKSFVTAAKKAEYWRRGIQDICAIILGIDSKFLNPTTAIPATPPVVEIKDSVQQDQAESAAIAETLMRAQAGSIEKRVRVVNPDWDDNQVEAEVQAILSQTGMGQELP